MWEDWGSRQVPGPLHVKFPLLLLKMMSGWSLWGMRWTVRHFLLQQICLPNDAFCGLKIKCIFGSYVHQLKRRAGSPDIKQQQNNLGPKCIFNSKRIIHILLNEKLWVGKHPGYCFLQQVNSSTQMHIILCNSQGLRKYLLNQLTLMKFVFQLSVYNVYAYQKNRRELNHTQKSNQKSWLWNDHWGLEIKTKGSPAPATVCKPIPHVSTIVKAFFLLRPFPSLFCTTDPLTLASQSCLLCSHLHPQISV